MRIKNTCVGILRKIQVYLRALLVLWRRSQIACEPDTQIAFDIVGDLPVKQLRSLFIIFQVAGFSVLWRARPGKRALILARISDWHHNVYFMWRDPSDMTLRALCSDHIALAPRKPNKIMHLRFDYHAHLALDDKNFGVPFPMHPQLYVQYREHEHLERYRSTTRRVRILFSGNWNQDTYDNPVLTDLFGLQSRYQIMDYLRRNHLYEPIFNGSDGLMNGSGEYQNRFCAIPPGVRIDQGVWLKFMARADFFLCPPGIILPYSQNAIEAMAVGTIPLINYPNWFFPPLIDGINCIVFSSLNDLRAALERIHAMDDSEIQKMRYQVISYYNEYLDPKKCVMRWLDSPAREITLHIWDERESALREMFGSRT